jgi:membrane protease YdiL (CAAX protease family)
MGSEFAWEVVPAFLVSVVAGAVFLAWLYNASRSVLLPMLAHATINTAGAGYAFSVIAPEHMPQFWWIYVAVWSAIAASTVLLTLGRLGAARTD